MLLYSRTLWYALWEGMGVIVLDLRTNHVVEPLLIILTTRSVPMEWEDEDEHIPYECYTHYKFQAAEAASSFPRIVESILKAVLSTVDCEIK